MELAFAAYILACLGLLLFIGVCFLIVWNYSKTRVEVWRHKLTISKSGKFYIYFVWELRGTFSASFGEIKVGRTNNLTNRLKTFQTANSGRIQVLGILRVRDDHKAEKLLHDKMEPYRIRKDGEWFLINPFLLFIVATLSDRKLTQEFNKLLSE